MNFDKENQVREIIRAAAVKSAVCGAGTGAMGLAGVFIELTRQLHPTVQFISHYPLDIFS
ncbi:MAG: hypothetical protein Q7K21_07395 [Elusimicrobiota bacterium]|nr:hypothetical protein [Elusimicrobiota bacterium]